MEGNQGKMENMIPLLPCKSLDATVEFYQALGFAVTHEQSTPYLYAAVQRGNIEVHFSSLSVYGAKNAFGASLVFVPTVQPYHAAFVEGLHSHYGKVPVAGLPRITRLRQGHTRFTLFDPSGNMLIFIDQHEPEIEYGAFDINQSPLAAALQNAAFLRDTYANDAAAAKTLDTALRRSATALPLDRALALAARAELAVALGDGPRAQHARHELGQIALSAEEVERFSDALGAADELERWLS